MPADKPEAPRKRRVLVVDDHIDAAHSLAVLLRHMGHEVQYAINGYSALELADRFHPDVVFVDMVLPDFHGSDLSRRITGEVLYVDSGFNTMGVQLGAKEESKE